MTKFLHRSLILGLLLCFGITAQSVNKTIIYGDSYIVDTLQCSKVGPGTVYAAIKFTGETNNLVFRAFFLTIDVENNPNLEYRMELANDSIIGVETVRSHAEKRSKPGEYYIAGSNGDFYSTQPPVGIPSHGSVQNGQIATTPPAGISHFCITDDMKPWCTRLTQSTSLKINGGNSVNINRVNGNRYTNELVLFTSVNGKYTHAPAGGKEIAIQLLEGEKWKINSPIKAKVIGIAHDRGNMAIAAGQGVLSADGSAMAIVDGLKEGDEIELNLSQTMSTHDGIAPNITQVLGANTFLVENGNVTQQGDMARHPRTMYGYSKDHKKIIVCAFDGRSTLSSGGIYYELADVMIYAGAHWAVNSDGGGSTTMYVQNIGVMNNPSDGKERAVSNGMYLVLKTPEDNEVAEIQFMDWAMKFPKHGVYRPVFYGYNKYGMLIDTDVKGVKLSCPAELGYIENDNTFIGSGNGTHALTAEYKGKTTSIAVTVAETDDVALRLNKVIVDGFKPYAIEVQAKMNEKYMPISPSILKWATDDASIAVVQDGTGELQGVATGTTTIHGSVGNFNGALEVVVEKPTQRYAAIDPEMDIETWKISQAGGKNIVATPLDKGMKLTYTGSSDRAPNIKLAKKIQLWSLPDTIRLRINPGDAPINKITISTNANGSGVVNSVVATPKANELNVIDLPTASWCDVKDMANYPININYISLGMGTSTTGTEYVIEIPGIEVVYDAIAPSGVESVTKNATISITPNPAMKGEPVIVTLSDDSTATVAIYNMAGAQLSKVDATPINNTISVKTTGLESGIYIITITQKGATHSSKLIIK